MKTIGLILILCLSVFGSTWYNNNWTNRSRIDVIGTSAGAQTNYQVKLAITYADGMAADFSDLRFTSSDSTTLIPYWIETYTASTSATVWVKVPSIPAATDSTYIFMYYNNPAASLVSSGDSTFASFDSFYNLRCDLDTMVYSTKGLGSVVKYGNKYYATYDSVYDGKIINIMTSTDGLSFTKRNVAITSTPNTQDSNHIGLGYMWVESDTFYMTYRGQDTGDVKKAFLAWSTDTGKTWTKSPNNPIKIGDEVWEVGGNEIWGIMKINGTYYIYYSDFGTVGGGLTRKIGVMTTTSRPINWSTSTLTNYASNPIFGSYNRCPDVFREGNYKYIITTTGTTTLDTFHMYRDTSAFFTNPLFIRDVLVSSDKSYHPTFVDMPFVMTNDINRNTFPDTSLTFYFTGINVDPNYRYGMCKFNSRSRALSYSIDSAAFDSKWVTRVGAVSVNRGLLVLTGIASPQGQVDFVSSKKFKAGRIRSYFKGSTTSIPNAIPLGARKPNNDSSSVLIYGSSTANRIVNQTTKSGVSTTTNINSCGISGWHTWELNWNGVDSAWAYKDDTLKVTDSTNITTDSLVLTFKEGTGSVKAFVDWVAQGKFVQPEPTYNSIDSIDTVVTPVIDSIRPYSSDPGDSITVFGSGFYSKISGTLKVGRYTITGNWGNGYIGAKTPAYLGRGPHNIIVKNRFNNSDTSTAYNYIKAGCE